MSATSARKSPAASTHRVWAALFAPVDNAFLAYIRVLFGGIMLWEVFRYFSHGWVRRYYIEPKFYFSYFGFDWVKPWPGDGMYVHFLVLGALALCILLGLFYRVAAALFFLGFTYVFLLDETRYLNHFYLISLLSFLLIFVPAERVFSIDEKLNPALRSNTAPGWTLWLLRAQLGFAYFFGGVAKLSPDWLKGEPMRSWLSGRTDFPVIGRYFREEWMVYGFVYGGLLLDLLIVPLLLWRRTRLWAYLGALLFHLTNARLFQIGIFPWFMLFGTLIFFPPDLPRRIVGFLAGGSEKGKRPARRTAAAAAAVAKPVSTPARATMRERLIMGGLLAWLLFQVLVPLRHFLYPGEVNWTEEGHRFSWHMKLRDKEAEATFYVTDLESDETWPIDSRQFLTARQEERMASTPDMLVQYAGFLVQEMRKLGHENVEVHARVLASVNGREPQLLIDPTFDLGKERRRLWPPSPWIIPLSTPLPVRGGSDRIGTEESETTEEPDAEPEQGTP